jgi:uroporphyrinogen-III synthase
MPLKHRRVLITRAKHQAGELSGKLRALGARVIEIPSIEIRPPRSYDPLDRALENVARYEWLILTSVNGVDALFRRLAKLKKKPNHLANLKLCAIGPATAEAIVKRGLKLAVVPEKYVAEAVVEALASQVKGKKVLLVRAKVARDVIPRELRRAGAKVDVIEAYETVAPEASRKRLQAVLKNTRLRPDAVTFTSSSTAKNFVELLRGRGSSPKLVDGVLLASIGPVTSQTLREVGLRADVEAAEYTMDGLVQALVQKLVAA